MLIYKYINIPIKKGETHHKKPLNSGRIFPI